jgi:hypothetical protein
MVADLAGFLFFADAGGHGRVLSVKKRESISFPAHGANSLLLRAGCVGDVI